MENDIFTLEELHELEALEIRGGNAPGGYDPMAQPNCGNTVTGCGGGGPDQDSCTNHAVDCACTVTPVHGTSCLQQPHTGCNVSQVCSFDKC